MVFSSLVFLCVFLPVVFLLYYLIPTTGARNILLIIASLLFYAYGEPVYILLMLISVGFNYGFGRLIGRNKHPKQFLILSVILNLGMLFVFKYAGWFVQSVDQFTGLTLPIPVLELPIGISFYTFQAMSYVIDVYRGEAAMQKKLRNFCLYISFFPQLIAGPIVKYHDIDAQIENRHADMEEIAKGFRRFTVGLGKKVLISNAMGSAADAIFALDGGELNILSAWIGAVAYLMQIYFDFSGYSDMAIGMGHMFGFHFLENFNYPYISQSIKEFWRRWHISLSTWFKEYLYIPLGGNRKGKVRTCLNKIIVFFCTGLWHGANWPFVLWGLFHGCFLLLEDFVPIKKLPRWIKHIYVLLVVLVGFVLFRADTISQAGEMLANLFAGFDFSQAAMIPAMEQLTPLFLVTLAVAILASTPIVPKLRSSLSAQVKAKLQPVSFVASAVVLVLCLLYLAGGAYNPFIYFRF